MSILRLRLGLGLAMVAPLLACTLGPEGAPSGDSAAVPTSRSEPRYTVELATVARADLETTLDVMGSLEGLVAVDVVPDVAGRLDAVHVELGDRVRVGQPLAQIRDDDLVTRVRQAEHGHEVTRATLRQREVDLRLARTTRDRARQLSERGLISRDELDDAEARALAQDAQVDLARAQFEESEARLDELRLELAEATIRSPLDGFVARRHLDPGAFASSSAPVVSIVDIRRVKLVANVVERDFRRVRPGIPTQVTVDAYPSEVFEGTVTRVAPVLDPVTRTAEMEIEIVNQDLRLKPGMYARASISTDQRPHTLVVPRNALVSVAGSPGVFTARSTPAGDVATFVPVEVGVQDETHVEVVVGISEGDEVITTGAAGLTDGEPVTVLRPRRPGATS